MREWRSGNVGAFQAHVESSILSSRTKSLQIDPNTTPNLNPQLGLLSTEGMRSVLNLVFLTAPDFLHPRWSAQSACNARCGGAVFPKEWMHGLLHQSTSP